MARAPFHTALVKNARHPRHRRRDKSLLNKNTISTALTRAPPTLETSPSPPAPPRHTPTAGSRGRPEKTGTRIRTADSPFGLYERLIKCWWDS